jgi:hypothetical protein
MERAVGPAHAQAGGSGLRTDPAMRFFQFSQWLEAPD